MADVEHPALGWVPICGRHVDWLLEDATENGPNPTKMIPPLAGLNLSLFLRAVRFTKQHYEFLAWSIRQIESARGTLENVDHMQSLAEEWADELRGTNVAFKRDRFISAVVNGEW